MRWLPLLALAACGGEPDLCDDAPYVSMETFGRGFFDENCQSCHASTSPDRHDAPTAVVFDTDADVWRLWDRILDVATGPSPIMPPEGGVDADDRYRLEVMLTCFQPDVLPEE